MKPFSQPSVMNTQTHFSNVPSADIPRSSFDRSHAYKTTFDAGMLIPVFWDEVLPGDTFHLKQTAFARLATPLKPFMDNLFLDTHYFFVPYRLVWNNWEKFMGERVNPDDDPSVYSIPTCKVDTSLISGSIMDYFGLPKSTDSRMLSVSGLPFRAYVEIWNEWYRDENLQDTIPFNKNDGTDEIFGSLGGFPPLPRGKRKDYFTSCLPWPQKGDEVVIPLGSFAPVRGIGTPTNGAGFSHPNITVHETGGNTATYVDSLRTNDATYFTHIQEDPDNPGYPLIWADLTEATAVAINDLRTAFQIQRLLERDARGGTRYIEIILSHFGVRSDDARLQRPEYLGGDTSRINVNPIASTFTNAEVPQGQLAGVGTSVLGGGFRKSFTEHGIVIGVVSARADLTYQNGVDRFWSRRTRYDFYWPAFAHLGEQAVLNKEVYYSGAAVDEEVFGYQERFAEYRYKPSRVTGLFASNDAASLDYWHLAQDFDTLPVLNDSFIRDNPPIDRVIAVPTEPHFLLDCWFDYRCQRPMPVYSVPGFVDHF